ncbi:nucleotide exchange factor GrpE [Tsukamurella paurometabola]|uniref:GrpE n=1 Tax=Tsukamurella paurometabola TaxID=2061 RepID=A0A3P8ME89_TSUPA|nr:nucleotide exchange factor GrpE [Tsukamurella paurometabola]UEA84140.1 nucleotide exchange factor GrpE [Tsukamurella paurometabola]VDR41306.1 GrpE [Tsukamurella paurometabola]
MSADEAATAAGEPAANPDDRLAERVEDLARILARQAGTVERLADAERAREARDRAGADLPLVVELFALLGEVTACADTAESERERAAFAAVASRVERLLVGRGGTVVAPGVGDAFDPAVMEAADVVPTDDEEADRTVAEVLTPGLGVPARNVRPARVVVRAFRSA